MLFGITAMLLVGGSWTIYGYVMGKAPKQQISIPVLLFISYGITFICSSSIGCFQGIPSVNTKVILLTAGALFLSGIFNCWQLELMSQAMQKGPNGIIWSIVQSGFIFPFFMGIICFGVPMTWLRGFGFGAALISIFMFGAKTGAGDGNSWKLLTFGAFCMTGLNQCLSNLPSYFTEAEAISSIWRTAALSGGFLLSAIVRNSGKIPEFCRELGSSLFSVKLWLLCALLECVQIFSHYLLLFPGMDALSKAGAGAVAYPVMVGSCLIVFDLFSIFGLREKHSWRQHIALFLCIIGMICLSAGR